MRFGQPLHPQRLLFLSRLVLPSAFSAEHLAAGVDMSVPYHGPFFGLHMTSGWRQIGWVRRPGLPALEDKIVQRGRSQGNGDRDQTDLGTVRFFVLMMPERHKCAFPPERWLIGG
jgi:hypothetical protein